MESAVASLQVRCPACHQPDVLKQGSSLQGQQRYRGKHPSCLHQPVLVEYRHQGRLPAGKQQMFEMTLTGRGMRDMARVLPMRPTAVIEAFTTRASAPAHP
jgi:transposase-like protein